MQRWLGIKTEYHVPNSLWIYQITLKFQVICWDVYYFSERIRCRLQKTPNFQWILPLKKKFSGGSLCTRGVAGNWAVDLFSTTYFGEIIIFVVSKDQTFRVRCTLMNPEQFLILVPYLIITNIGTYFKFLVLAIAEKFLGKVGQFSIFFAFAARIFLTKLFITFDRFNRFSRMMTQKQ